MITLPFWATALISFGVKLVTQWLANLRAEQALQDLGAATQANATTAAAAEAAETKARAAGDAAEDGPDDERDILPETRP
jgi:hypothetical protein